MASGEKIRIFVSTEQDRKTIQLFLHFCELVEKCDIETTNDGVTSLECDAVHLDGLSTICRHLVISSSTVDAKQVLGEDPETVGQISEWVNNFLADRTPSGDDLLIRLNDHLEDKIYIAGNCLTFADLIIFVELYPVAELLPAAQYNQFCNFLRWHDFIQGLINFDEVLPPIKRKIPVFDFRPPSKAASKKDKKKEGKGKHKKPDGQQEGSLSKDSSESSEDSSEASKEAKKKAKQEKKKEKEAKKQEKKSEEVKSSDNEEKKLEKEEKKRQKAEKKKTKEENKEKKNKGEITVDALDLRIGQITSIKLHPNADSLYIEEIDLGEEKSRQIISGLVKFVPKEDMENRKVVVCCNLKPATMRGEKSFGMVMCASDSSKEKVDPIIPPADSTIGERVTFEGYSNDPIEEIKPKQKILEVLFPDLLTDADNIAKYKDTPFMTTHGPITSSIPNGHIS